MKISKQELIEMGAYQECIQQFVDQTNNTGGEVDVASLVGGLNTYDDLTWLACEKLPKSRIVSFACDCALLNIEKIKPYTDKYDLIVDFFKNPDSGTADTVYSTARAAAAAGAARTNRDVAAAAAAFAADAADCAAAVYYSYVADEYTAHDYATYAANSSKEVNELLIAIFNEYQ